MILEEPGIFSLSVKEGGKIQLDLEKQELLPYEVALLSDSLIRAFHEVTHSRLMRKNRGRTPHRREFHGQSL